MAQIDIAALDPVDAFTTTLRDLLQIVDVFKKNDSIPPIDLLRALDHAKETLNAVNTVVLLSMRMQVHDRIPEDVAEEFKQEIAARDLARLDDSSESQVNSLKRLLSPFSMEFDVDEDDLPPGFFGVE